MSAFFLSSAHQLKHASVQLQKAAAHINQPETEMLNAFLTTTGLTFMQRHPKDMLFLKLIPLYHDRGILSLARGQMHASLRAARRGGVKEDTRVHQCGTSGLLTPPQSLGTAKVGSGSWTGWPSPCWLLILNEEWVCYSRKKKSI